MEWFFRTVNGEFTVEIASAEGEVGREVRRGNVVWAPQTSGTLDDLDH
ncbi:hypothetical protein ABZ545_21990 [Streptomyces abikoensis]